jgi:receptor expression-enhancing protein 5/6
MTSEMKEQAQGYINKLKAWFKKEIDLISEKTGVDGKIISTVLLISSIFCFINLFSKYITCLVGVILPAYWSIKAIESPQYDDDKQWLTYWAIYGLFTLLDQFANIILRIFPFYFIFKIIFLIWCFMPNTMGALFIYNKFVAPYFKKYEDKIDKKIEKFIREGKLRGKNKNRLQLRKEAMELIQKEEELLKQGGEFVNNKINEKLK